MCMFVCMYASTRFLLYKEPTCRRPKYLRNMYY